MKTKHIVEILRKISFFEGLDDRTLEFIASVGEGVNVKAGDVLFQEGAAGDCVYLIIKGKIEVYKTDNDGYRSNLATLGTADILGEMALLDESPRSASAQALEDSILISLKRMEFQLFLQSNFAVALKLLSTLSRKLRDVNDKLTERNRRGYFP
nr:cyclic nucleotide-binding domain-containing protein [uncultured Anaeromusa sp.]